MQRHGALDVALVFHPVKPNLVCGGSEQKMGEKLANRAPTTPRMGGEEGERGRVTMNVGSSILLEAGLLLDLKRLALFRGPLVLGLRQLSVQHLHDTVRVCVVVNGTMQ